MHGTYNAANTAVGFSRMLNLPKTPSSPGRFSSATNGFYSFDVPSGKTVLGRSESLWKRAVLRKSSLSSRKEVSRG
ncbi:hypothetical protein HY003_02575 [Candidatus Saccharibacteria bacterium]|nr:hypothetical protein [Candidatus Saccharibacteria bacterium]MBI3338162.1 hypothetical protein [Candidatus Saccharibacteria bacterium]